MTCTGSSRQGIVSPGIENQSHQYPVDFFQNMDSASGLMQKGAASIFDDAFNPSENGMEFISFKSEPSAQSEQHLASNPCQVSSVYSNYATNVDRLWLDLEQQQVLAHVRQIQMRTTQHQKHDSPFPENTRKSTYLETKNYQSSRDPVIEKKISQLLKSMRQGGKNDEGEEAKHMSSQSSSAQDSRKNKKEMDDDERLLASEEGKMLSSKERRQLRNKVSARAFRSRRKGKNLIVAVRRIINTMIEYINQLEDQIALNVTEIGDLRAQNQALVEENIRLSDLTRMLLSLPSIPGLLESLVINTSAAQDIQTSQDQMDVIT